MFGKLVYGQFSLKETFWKFGVLGTFVVSVITKIFKQLLLSKLQGLTIVTYYMRYFSPVNMDGTLLFFTIAYFVCLFSLVLYSIFVILGVWRSSAEYDKSVWLRHIARLFILGIVYVSVKAAI